jgi:uncharacterized protein YlxP (DUF503 family)
VAIAEVGFQELHQRALLEIAAVAAAEHVVNDVLDAVERLIWSAPAAEVIQVSRTFVEQD